MNTSSAQLAQAISCQRQGRLAEAVTIYRQLLASEPNNGDALHHCGVAMAQMGRVQDAVGLFAAAVQAQPANPVMQANLGRALGDLGRHTEALQCYERALALKPDLAAIHRGRGTTLLQLGRIDEALASLQQAVRLAPSDAHAQSDLGVVLERAARHQDALQCFKRAIALDPNHAEAHHNLALILAALGRHAEALASIERALALQPRQPQAHSNRGNALRALGRPAEALESYQRALAIQSADAITLHNRGLALMDLERPVEALASFDQALALASSLAPSGAPGSAQTHFSRGRVCLQLGRASDALASFERALALVPQDCDAHFYRGYALALLERHAESLASFDQAVALKPDYAEALNNRGVALGRLSRPHEALESFAMALASKPDYAEAHTNAGNTHKALKRYDEALRSFDCALSIRPDDVMSTWSKALLTLTLGDLAQGWPLYESRFRLQHLGSLQRSLDMPRWSGSEPLEGRSIFVYAEQGIGDALQFCRYLQLLTARGARVVFEVQPTLLQLMRTLTTPVTLVAAGQPAPRCDYFSPLLSLPLAFGTTLDSIPGGVPYLAANTTAVSAWRQRLAALPGFKVGLNWQGNLEAERQAWVRGRSFALSEAAPIASVPGVSLVSLQKGAAAGQRSQVDFGARLLELTDPLDTGPEALADTAALLVGLDLVITSDTALAHLAGALGIPVWVVLHAVPDWRWLTERSDTPWYPSMRLFRQHEAGDWPEVFDRVAAQLAALLVAPPAAERRSTAC
jgi:tetratricopeptide (TPR) repeat protein